MLDFSAVRANAMTMDELVAGMTKWDLHKHTDDMIDAMLEAIRDASDADVVFQPTDPEAKDTFAQNPEDAQIAWTLGHVIVHANASSEESAALALELARGVPVEKRSRFETAWESVTTIRQCRQALEESRKMRHAMLEAWPQDPHLDVTYVYIPQFGPLNCFTRFILGLRHEDSHLPQVRDIVNQALAARSGR
jgi:hypothetical protein